MSQVQLPPYYPHIDYMKEYAKTYLRNAVLLQAFSHQLMERNELISDLTCLGVHPYLTKLNLQGGLDVVGLYP